MPRPDQADRNEAVRRRDAYHGSTARIQATLRKHLAKIWEANPELRDEDAARLILRLTPLVQAGQLQMAAITSAYLARQAVLLRGVPYAPIPVDRAEILDLRGVPVEDVYRRPIVTVYTALSEGKSYADARAAGLNRLLKTAGMDLQRAKMHQGFASLNGSGAEYYRRTLTGGENCGLCVKAATQRYRVKTLAALHGGCDCGIEELPATEDPSQIIDPALLEAVTALEKAEGKLGRDQILAIREHGELGPILTLERHRFTGPAALEDL